MKTTAIQKAHFIPTYFANPQHPISITLVGVGGTGSLILSRLVRIDQGLKQLGHPGLMVRAIDGDKVEPHNIGRQNFTPSDIGCYKADRSIQKINMAFGLQWKAINEFVTKDSKEDILANIIITAVDSAKVRTLIKKMMDKTFFHDHSHEPFSSPYYWMDTGNGKDFGQVVLSTIGAFKQPETKLFDTVGKLNDVEEIFGKLELSDTKENQGMESCSFRESIKHQDLFINDSIAVEASNLIWKMFTELYITSHGSVINHKKGTRPIKLQ